MSIQILRGTAQQWMNSSSMSVAAGQPAIITSSEYAGGTFYVGTGAPLANPVNGVGQWHNLTIASGFTVEIARWRFLDFGKNVQLQIKVTNTQSSRSLPVTLCTLPQLARPITASYRLLSPGTGNNISRCEISAWNGNVQWYNTMDVINNTTNVDNGHWVDIQCIYPANGPSNPIDGVIS